jgi:hypothetical protein
MDGNNVHFLATSANTLCLILPKRIVNTNIFSFNSRLVGQVIRRIFCAIYDNTHLFTGRRRQRNLCAGAARLGAMNGFLTTAKWYTSNQESSYFFHESLLYDKLIIFSAALFLKFHLIPLFFQNTTLVFATPFYFPGTNIMAIPCPLHFLGRGEGIDIIRSSLWKNGPF